MSSGPVKAKYPNLADAFGEFIQYDENGITINAGPNKNISLQISGSGEVTINGSALTPGGAVTSVFGRSGAVVAESDDYADVSNLSLSDGTAAAITWFTSILGLLISGAANNGIELTDDGSITIFAGAGGVLSLVSDPSNPVSAVTLASILALKSFTFATLPANPVEGTVAYCSNGRKSGEGAGLGTGIPVYFSYAGFVSGSWYTFAGVAVTH